MVVKDVGQYIYLLAAAAALFPLAASGQTGSVHGVVVDAETGETLIGANVIVQGTITGATTDLEGRYEIRSLDPGTYELTTSYLGYAELVVTGVEVAAGQAVQLDFQLTPEAVGLDEVVVEARAARNAEAALLRERQKAGAVSDAISAEAIARTGSSTASDAMQRVAGASVVGGKYVYVRGLGDRYTNTQLNGTTLPSADPDRNAVPLDLFPAALLDNIVTTKTFTPDKPGSFTGGSVDIGTRAFPERLAMSFSSSVGIDGQSVSSAQILAHETGSSGSAWLHPGTAPGVPGVQSPNHVQARRNPEMARTLDQLARAFRPEMVPRVTNASLESSYGVSVGNQVALFGRPVGFLGSLTYDRDFSAYSGGTSATYLLTGNVAEVNELNVQQKLSDERSTSEVLWGGLGTVSIKPHPDHSIGATLMYNRSMSDDARYLTGTVPRNFAPERRLESRVLARTERTLQSIQLKGEHAFQTRHALRSDWSIARTRTEQEEPDLRYFANDFTVSDRNGTVDTLYSVAVSNYTAPTRYFRNLAEDGWEGRLNVALPVEWGSNSVTFKAGGAFNRRTRDFREQRFEYVIRTPYDGDPVAFFSQVGVLDSTAGPNGMTYEIGNYLVDASSPRNNYDGRQDVQAAYGMAELRLFRQLRVITGVRFEHTRIDVASRDSTIADARLRNADWLPSLNLVYELGRMNVRVAYGKTLARPTFRELAPFTSFSFINAPTLSGNPDLERTLVHNVDLRWEWFVRPGEVVAVSGFGKRFINPIERTILNNNFETRFENVDAADVYGIEVEARKRLDDIWRPLRGIEMGGNLTLTHSRVDIPAEELMQIRALDPNASSTRALQGQSPYVVNLDVAYQAPGTTISAMYNVFGRRLSDVSLGGTPNIYERPFHSIDLIASQQLTRWVRLKATVRNLLDARVERAYPFKGQDYLASSYRPGRSASLSLTLHY